MYYLESGYGKDRRLRNAIIVAIGVHIIVLLSLTFRSETDPYQAPQMEVTLAITPSSTVNSEARHIAQANQAGDIDAGSLAQMMRPESGQAGESGAMSQLLPTPRETRSEQQQDAVTTVAEAQRRTSQDPTVQEESALPGVSSEAEELARELADLEAELDQQSRNYADLPRVRRLTSVASKESVDARYLLDWRQRVEAVGNKYYPEASVRYGIYGSLRLLVVIRADGSLEDIRVLSSSGFAVLDEAAIKIVRLAAPFAPFPAELRASADKLEIIRTWQFQENRLSSQ